MIRIEFMILQDHRKPHMDDKRLDDIVRSMRQHCNNIEGFFNQDGQRTFKAGESTWTSNDADVPNWTGKRLPSEHVYYSKSTGTHIFADEYTEINPEWDKLEDSGFILGQ